jgi:hypothetical protein
VLAKVLSMRTMTFLPRSKPLDARMWGNLNLIWSKGSCRIATTWPLPVASRIRDKAWQAIGKSIPNAKKKAKTNMELPDEARD